MKWEALMPPKEAGSEQATVAVEAKNWLAALNAALEQTGEAAVVASNLKCDVRENGTVSITDFRRKMVYQLKPVEQRPASVSVLPPPGESFLESKSAGRRSAAPQAEMPMAVADIAASDAPPTPAPMLDHKVFFVRDENPTAQSNLVYRERLVAVPGPASREEIESLLLYYFETLRRHVVLIEGARYVNIAVYPGEFKGRPTAAPMGALSWQDWKDPAPQVVFPAVEPVPAVAQKPPVAGSGDAPAAVSPRPADAVAMVSEEASRAPTVPVQTGPVPVPEPKRSEAPAPPPEAPAPPQTAAQPAQAATHSRKRTPSQEMHVGRDLDQPDPSEVLAQLFEEMQDLFLTQNQDDSAAFVLEIARKKIPAEAGSVFLADINTRELYFAAVYGPTADKLRGQRLHMTKGLVGFAARQGATIASQDVRQGPRFCDEFDQSTSFVTRSVMCSPIQYEGRTYGALEILNRRGSGVFTESEVSVVSYMARQLAEFIATGLPSVDTDIDADDKKPAAAPAPRASISGPGKGKPKPKVKGRK